MDMNERGRTCVEWLILDYTQLRQQGIRLELVRRWLIYEWDQLFPSVRRITHSHEYSSGGTSRA